MANLTREQEWADRNHNRSICWFPENGGCRRHNPNIGWTDPGSARAKAYNAVHGTNIVDDRALDQFLANEAEMKRLLRENES